MFYCWLTDTVTHHEYTTIVITRIEQLCCGGFERLEAGMHSVYCCLQLQRLVAGSAGGVTQQQDWQAAVECCGRCWSCVAQQTPWKSGKLSLGSTEGFHRTCLDNGTSTSAPRNNVPPHSWFWHEPCWMLFRMEMLGWWQESEAMAPVGSRNLLQISLTVSGTFRRFSHTRRHSSLMCKSLNYSCETLKHWKLT